MTVLVLVLNGPFIAPLRSYAAPTKRALLIGVSRYPAFENNPAVPVLHGPANDVGLLRRTLERTGFGPEHIQVLESSLTNALPTRAAILQALQTLADGATAGDFVVLYFSGHGSQQPSHDTGSSREPDGLDEIFLPMDAGNWSDGSRSVVNALVDDEIGMWIRRIRARGAFVWFLADCCHAGTLTRGTGSTGAIPREIPARVLIPPERLPVRDRLPPETAAKPSLEWGEGERLPGGFVGMYACQADETTVELPLGRGGEFFGLFTYRLVEFLERTRPTITYRELGERLQASYRALGWHRPSPMIEGENLDAPIFGGIATAENTPIFLRRDAQGQRLTITAGRLLGLTRDSILSVESAGAESGAGSAGQFIRVTDADLLTADVEPTSYRQKPLVPTARLADGARCELLELGPQDFRTRVILQTLPQDGGQAVAYPVGRGPEAVEQLWRTVEAERWAGSRLMRVSVGSEAEWALRWDSQNGVIRIVPLRDEAIGEAGGDFPVSAHYGRGQTVSLGLDAEAQQRKVAETFRRLLRAEGLARLAEPSAPLSARSGQNRVNIRLTLHRHATKSDSLGRPLIFNGARTQLEAGELVSAAVTNTGPTDVDVTFFWVDAGYGITALRQVNPDRVKSGEAVRTRLYRIKAGTVGTEQIIAIAVRSDPQTVADLTYLEQPAPLVQQRGKRKTPDNPLTAYLEWALDGVPMRGATPPPRSDYAVESVPFRVQASSKRN